MIKRNFIIASMLFIFTSHYAMHDELPAPAQDIDNDPLFVTKNLVNTQGVRHHLEKYYGAKSVTFKTEDNITLHGTFIARNGATHTTIVPGGFYPGNKESMASWARVLPSDGNIIFFDARGHGRSEGLFWRNISQYAVDEYKDLLPVLDFAKAQHKPIIINPLCAGVIHTVHALKKLKDDKKLDDYDVRALIVDSSFTSPMAVLPAGVYHFREKAIPQLLRSYIYPSDSTTEVKNRLLYKLIWNFIGSPFIHLLTYFARAGIEKNDPVTRIDDKIHELQHIPMQFIHAKQDNYTGKENAEILKEKHNNPQDEIFIFEDSDHANNILKKKKEYRDAVAPFIAKVMKLSDSKD